MLEDSSYMENLHVEKNSCQLRTNCLTDISYDLKLNLSRGEYFSGYIQITFKVLSLPQVASIPIDFRGIKVA